MSTPRGRIQEPIFAAGEPVFVNCVAVDCGEGEGNPKDSIGQTKVPLSGVSEIALTEWALAVHEGDCKYGAKNFRHSKVKMSVYLDALERHVLKYRNGQDFDLVSFIHELGYVMANASIMIDAQAHGTLIDDRDRSGVVADVLEDKQKVVARIHELYGSDTRPLGEREGGGV